MTRKDLERGNEIIREMEVTRELMTLMSYPYPQFFSPDNNRTVNSAGLSERALSEIKKSITDILKAEENRLNEELETL
jgi:hypothetical protein